MYFESRSQAGVELTKALFDKYRYENTAVVSLSEGGILVGEQLAWRLHCVLMLLLSEPVEVAGEGTNFGVISQDGSLVINPDLSDGERKYFTNELFAYIEEGKRLAHQKLNRLLGDSGLVDKKMLKGRNVILVSDGFGDNVSEIDAAMDYLKTINTERIIVAAPVASTMAIDRLHVVADELHILSVRNNFFETDHYYKDNTLPDTQDTIDKINQVVLNWKAY